MTTPVNETRQKKHWMNSKLPVFSLFLIFLTVFSCKTNKKSSPELSDSGSTTVIRDTIIIRDTIETTGKQISVSADKMNVLYIGVDNPITISTPGILARDLRISGRNMEIERVGNGKYLAKVSQPGEGRIRVSGAGLTYSWFYRAKRIPDPVAHLGKSSGGIMGSGEFKAQAGVSAFLDNFDFDARCEITGFNLVYVARRQDPVPSANSGARYTAKSRTLVNRAKPGDIYYFNNVRAKCPGDNSSRRINSMVFSIR